MEIVDTRRLSLCAQASKTKEPDSPPSELHVSAKLELVETLSLEDAKLVAIPFTPNTAQAQADTLCELSETEKAIYMSLRSVAIHCTGQNGRDVCHERSEIANGESRFAGTAVVETSGKVLEWSSRVCLELSVPRQPITDRLLHGCRLGWRRGSTSSSSWSCPGAPPGVSNHQQDNILHCVVGHHIGLTR